jgi:hypothetical protein
MEVKMLEETTQERQDRICGVDPEEQAQQIEVANTIMRQLGGYGRLKAMVGIRDPVALEGLGGLGFKFPNKAAGRPNYVGIRLNGLDTYDVKFKRLHGFNVKTTAEYENIYWDQLKGLFEKETGLYLTL